jgi:ACR3 family arsenite efflux pump ArsB
MKIIKIIFYSLIFYLFKTEAFAYVIRSKTCMIPGDLTIGSLCVFSTLSLWVGIPLVIGIITSIFRSK